MDIIYIGPVCPRCINNKYKKVVYGSSEYKECIECGRTSAVSSSDNLEPLK